MRLRHLALKTRDLRTTERFYVDVLGLGIAFPHEGMLFLPPEDSITKIQARRGRSSVYVEDPNGYTVELYCD